MSDRADRYAARVDAELRGFSTDRARLWFLRNELEKWDQGKARFEVAINREDFDPGDITIWDFALTIAEINVRLGRVENAMAQAAMRGNVAEVAVS